MNWKKDMPEEFRQYLKPMPSDVLHACDPLFIFMDADALEAERQAIYESLPPHSGHHAESPSQKEAFDLSISFSECFQGGEAPNGGELRQRLGLLPRSKSRVLRVRLDQIRRAIWHARHYHGRDFDPTTVFAVPPVWRRRWETLLAGQLFPAYVGSLGINQF